MDDFITEYVKLAKKIKNNNIKNIKFFQNIYKI